MLSKLGNDIHLFSILRSEASWVVPVFGVAAGVMTFIAAGGRGLAIGCVVVLVIALVAQQRYILRMKSQPAATAEDSPGSATQTAGAAELTDSHTGQHEGPTPLAEERKGSGGSSGPTSPGQASMADNDPGMVAFNAAFAASQAKDVAETRRLADEFVATGDEEDRLRRRSLRELLLVFAGDAGALARLQDLADSNPEACGAQLRYALGLDSLGAKSTAIQELAARAQVLDDPADRAQLLLLRARLLLEMEDYAAALGECEEVDRLIGRTSDAEEIRGRCYLGLDEPHLALLHWVVAVDLDPTKHGLRFELAYQAGQADFDDLAICHYLALVKSGHATATALNNLGVDLQTRDSLAQGVKRWKEAADKGSAWGAGNLANALIDAGFISEAEEWVNRGRTMDGTSPRLGEAETKVAQALTSGAERESQLERLGWTVHQQLLAIADGHDEDLPSGDWVDSSNKSWSIVSSDGTARATSDGQQGWYEFKMEYGRLVVHRKRNEYADVEVGIAGYVKSVLCMVFSRGGHQDAEVVRWESAEPTGRVKSGEGTLDAADSG